MALRITIEEKPESTILKLEGRLAGPWVTELNRLWEQTSAAVNGQKVTLDLRETTFADARGIGMLRAIFKATGAELLTGSPWTEYLAEEVRRDHAAQDEEV